jgi:hypothetical protein
MGHGVRPVWKDVCPTDYALAVERKVLDRIICNALANKTNYAL